MASMFWQLVLADVETWLQADSVVAALVTHPQGDATVVDIAQGFTPAIDPPAIRLLRGPQGETTGTAWRPGSQGELPASFEFYVDMHAQSGDATDPENSAAAAWGVLGTLEAAVLASLRKWCAPERRMSDVIGAPYFLTIKAIAPVDESYWPAVASRITCVLNKE